MESKQLLGKGAQNISIHSDTVNKMQKKGESDDSDTDSEDEGYDSDVKREQFVDYSKEIFSNPIKHIEASALKTMVEEAKTNVKRFDLNFQLILFKSHFLLFF